MRDAMAATEQVDEGAPKKPSKLPMIIGLCLALAGGGGGYFAVTSGLLPLGESGGHAESHEGAAADHAPDGAGHGQAETVGDIAFVPIEPLIISLGPGATARHLRFKGQIETPSQYAAEVTRLMPRIVDVLNSYLRAVEEADFEQPSALVRLRAQMLRRIQIVTGQGRVNDLLIMEFVLN
ncbi:MAG: flagellar basal body-associated FliL family protein [Thalassovita sp.]